MPQKLDDATLKHFKLKRDPFWNDIRSTKDICLTTSHAIAELRLWKAAQESQMCAVIGEVGAGKSTLLKKLKMEMRREKQWKIVQMLSTHKKAITSTAICDAIIEDLEGKRMWGGIEKKAREIGRCLLRARDLHQKIVLIVDDAHEIPPPYLKDFKKLWELLEEPLLGVIFSGQPPLKETLENGSVREVFERCDVIEIKPIRAEVRAYLQWKLKRVGVEVEDVFEEDALNRLKGFAAATSALRINNYAASAMIGAQRIHEERVTADLMAEALRGREWPPA